MKLLLDTHLLLWATEKSPRLSRLAVRLMSGQENVLVFSVVSIWEIAIKHGKGLESFKAQPAFFRRALLDHGYEELALLGSHAVAVSNLPYIHKDPFDRLLIAQAIIEGITLLTADKTIASYPGPIRKV